MIKRKKYKVWDNLPESSVTFLCMVNHLSQEMKMTILNIEVNRLLWTEGASSK